MLWLVRYPWEVSQVTCNILAGNTSKPKLDGVNILFIYNTYMIEYIDLKVRHTHPDFWMCICVYLIKLEILYEVVLLGVAKLGIHIKYCK